MRQAVEKSTARLVFGSTNKAHIKSEQLLVRLSEKTIEVLRERRYLLAPCRTVTRWFHHNSMKGKKMDTIRLAA
jgi:hypothetical protein